MDQYSSLKSRTEELFISGLHCSQALFILSHEMRDITNPELIRAMGGLGGGLFCRLTCGTLTGGCCLLSSFGAKENEDDIAAINYKGLSIELVTWFHEEFGSIICSELAEADNASRLEVCPDIVVKTFIKCMELLTKEGVDVYL